MTTNADNAVTNAELTRRLRNFEARINDALSEVCRHHNALSDQVADLGRRLDAKHAEIEARLAAPPPPPPIKHYTVAGKKRRGRLGAW